MTRGKDLVLTTCPETGCITPSSHALNQDGYFRKRVDGKLVMYHRHIWESLKGSIPEGYEVDHMCRNRACCNIHHLQILSSKAHKIKTNQERYAPRKEAARLYWSNTKCSGTHLGEKFDVTFSAACRWIREWKV